MASSVTTATLLELYLPDGTYNLWDGDGTILIQNVTYFGTGLIVDVAQVRTTSEFVANDLTLTVAGASPEMMAIALTDNYQGARVVIKLVLLYKSSIVDKERVSIRFDGFISHANFIETDRNENNSTIYLHANQ